MAELADALDSGSSESNFMQVQVLFPAPWKIAPVLTGAIFYYSTGKWTWMTREWMAAQWAARTALTEAAVEAARKSPVSHTRNDHPLDGRFLYVFRQLSKAKQKPTRYAGGDKKLYK